MMLKNMTPRLAARGNIKIGVKGAMITSRAGKEFQPPQKLDHFVVTTLDRGPDGNFSRDEEVHRVLGSDTPRRLPIRLLFNDIEMNFMSRYAAFVGRTMWCAGDGVEAMRVGPDGKRTPVACPCERIEQGYQGKEKCKINGALSVIIDGISGVGNVWVFRTTSWNSVQNLTSSMQQIKALSGGVLAGLPLELVLAPKEVITPDGQMMKAWIVSLQFRGTVQELRDVGYHLLEAEKVHEFRVRAVEDEVRTRLALPAPVDVPIPGDTVSDIVEEFYPEQAVATPPRPVREAPTDRTLRPSTVKVMMADKEVEMPVVYSDELPIITPERTDLYRVESAFGEVSYEGLDREEAIRALSALAGAVVDEQERAALADLNPELWAALPTMDIGCEPRESPWDIGAEKQSRLTPVPLKNPATRQIRYFANATEWVEALCWQLGQADQEAKGPLMSANQAARMKLQAEHRDERSVASLKALDAYLLTLSE